jgi:hypothetical protein
VQCANLTDDELFLAMAANTDAMSDLLQQQADFDAEISRITDPDRRSDLMNSYVGTVNRFETDFRAYTAELRRRYPA